MEIVWGVCSHATSLHSKNSAQVRVRTLSLSYQLAEECCVGMGLCVAICYLYVSSSQIRSGSVRNLCPTWQLHSHDRCDRETGSIRLRASIPRLGDT